MDALFQGHKLCLNLGQGLLVLLFNGHGQQQFIVLQLTDQVLIGFDTAG